ncbi:STAS/SEC14 domain-containing protein [Evansella tamaricis]|uniref:STAS/SEC14 domain-containing protein n=1 Tax=Evansella tamaricis TaxID=2069301 RepID=A0ABS6JC06_9BACI|nr:STAS/SEC14 domain-containing protein [Evansella tamaricis]MBU9711212.1 STAS/SEC14 domain-containing protein [Evansella tamaricis]
MIALKTNQLDDVIEVEVNGKITAQEIKEFEDYFQMKKADNEKVKLLLVIRDVRYSLQGVLEDLKFDMNHWRSFKKIAVVSEKKWIEIGMKMADYLPGVKVEHFHMEEQEKAKAWLE